MTLSELLALVGRAWVRLFVYPGGVSLVAIAWLAYAWLPAIISSRSVRYFPATIWQAIVASAAQFPPAVLAAPWLAVALLPFPGAVDLGRSIDVVVLVALLDVPLLYTIRRDLRSIHTQQHAVARLSAGLNGYPPCVLAMLLLGSAGTLEIGQLAQAPAVFAPAAVAHWIGALGVVAVLPPVVGFGPFSASSEAATPLALQFRAVGWWAVASLPWMVPLDAFWQVIPPILLALLLWGFHRATRKQSARMWAKGYAALAMLLLLELLGNAGAQLFARLQ